MKRVQGIGFLLLILSGEALPGDDESGMPLIRNYSPKEYKAHEQNWSIVQDSTGLLYVANTGALLTYDGVHWTLISTPKQSTVRSLAVGTDGRVYVGAKGEFGYVERDSIGRIFFQSMENVLPKDALEFKDVWRIHVSGPYVYFQTNAALFRWDGSAFRIWRPQTTFVLSGMVDGVLYIQQRSVGLFTLNGDSLVAVPGGDSFSSDDRVTTYLPHDRFRLLLGSNLSGLYSFDGSAIRPFPTDDDGWLRKSQLYRGVMLRDGTYALTSILGGARIMDRGGRMIRSFDRRSGLQDEQVWGVYEDVDNGLWLALNKGLTRIEWPPAITVFGAAEGLEGTVWCLHRHAGKLYAGTSRGLNVLESGRFRSIGGVQPQVWGMASVGDQLWIASNESMYALDAGRVSTVANVRAFAVLPSTSDPTIVFIAHSNGLLVLKLNGKSWTVLQETSGLQEEIRFLAEMKDGQVWLGTFSEGVVQLDFQKNYTSQPRRKKFGPEAGLPNSWVTVTAVDGRPIFGTLEGLFGFNESTGKFYPDTVFGRRFTGGFQEVYPFVYMNGTVWASGTRDQIGRFVRTSEGFHWDGTPFRRVPFTHPQCILPETDSIVWVGGAEGIARIDLTTRAVRPVDWKVLLSRVLIQPDSLIAANVHGNRVHRVAIEPAWNALRFDYAAPRYASESKTLYETWLEGFESRWSPLSTETRKDYTNLPGGDYRFHVRATDVDGRQSLETVFAFTIMAPWYVRWWAWAGYGALGFLMVQGAVRYRLSVMRRRNDELERRVADRTKELRETQAQLVHSEKMASLGNMVAGMTHEINNPLTLIIPNLDYIRGELDRLIAAASQMDNNSLMDIRRDIEASLAGSAVGAERIRTIVSNLRAFANPGITGRTEVDVIENLDIVLDLFMYGRSRVRLIRRFEPVGKIVCVVGELNQCLVDILDNAVRAIDDALRSGIIDAGEIIVSTRKEMIHSAPHIVMAISDNGVGIPKDIQGKIFDPFFTTRVVGSGKGLGLSEAYGVIKNHGGTIDVDSAPGKGSCFTIRLPVNP